MVPAVAASGRERMSAIPRSSPGTIAGPVPYNRAKSDLWVRRGVVLAEEGVKPKKGFVEAAARWFGLLGVVAAAAALVLVPISIDLDAVLSNPAVAYYTAELRTFLVVSAVLLVAVSGMLVFDGRPLLFPVLIPVLALLGVSALSTFFSGRPAHSLYGDRGEGFLSVVAGTLLFYALAQGLTSRARLRLFLAAATTTAALVSVYGIAENYGIELISGWNNPPFSELGRISATIGNSLTIAGYLTLMMGAATALWMGSATRLGRLVWLVALALIGAWWFCAEARGAFLGAGLALPLVLLAVRRKMGTVRPLAVPFAVLVASMAVAVVVSAAFGFSTLSARTSAILLSYLALVAVFALLLERGRIVSALLLPLVALVFAVAVLVALPGGPSLSNLGVNRGASGGEGDISLQTRLYVWRDTVPMILDRPLLGHGPDNYREPFRPYISRDLKTLVQDGRGEVRSLDRAHNHSLQLAATTGLLGLFAYLWVLVSYFRNAYRRGGWVLAALSGVVLAYVIQLQTAFPSVATDVAFWGLLGASVAVMRLHDAQGAAEGPSEDDEPGPPPRPPGKLRGELTVVAATMAVVAAVAVPAFLQQREKAFAVERRNLAAEVRETVDLYERTYSYAGVYPETGVYDTEHPVKNRRGGNAIKPRLSVTIKTASTPEGDFMVEGKSSVLAGTVWYSYDSASDEYSVAPNPDV